MKLAYTALNTDYQKVSGVITAENTAAAKEELHKMGLSVLTIEEAKGDAETGDMNDDASKNFWFFVRDENGAESSGTIEAVDRKNAFRRLNTEYKLEIVSLCPEFVPAENRLEEGKKGLAELESQIEAEFGMKAIHYSSGQEDDDIFIANKNFEGQRKQILKEVDSIIEKAEEMLTKYQHRISGGEFQKIQKSVDTLMRMKLSNNLLYIRNLSEELFENIHALILKYEGRSPSQEGISDLDLKTVSKKSRSQEVAEELAAESEKAIQATAVKHASTLTHLRSMSNRLNTLLHKEISFSSKQKKEQLQDSPETEEQMSPDKQSGGDRKSVSSVGKFEQSNSASSLKKAWEMLYDILFTKSESFRKRRWQALRDMLQEWKGQVRQKFSDIKVKAHTSREQMKLGKLETSTGAVLLQEVRLFVNFLFGFYVVFLLFAEYSFVKGFTPVLPFLQNLFQTSFLVHFGVFLFFVSLTLGICRHSLRCSKTFLLSTSFCSFCLFLLFVINF